MERTVEVPLGVVIERRAIDNPWQRWRWRPVSVIPGGPPIENARVLLRGEGWMHVHAATLPLRLHRRETEAYRVNLSNRPPRVWVVLRPREEEDAESERAYRPLLVTASPYEAQDYLDSAEDIVEAVRMPDEIIAWVQAFVDRHHVDEPFRKRKRDRVDPQTPGPGRGPGAAGGGRRFRH
jgi:Protein of unknown function (DUF3305)